MFKNYSKSSKLKKTLVAALCCVTVTCTGLASACSSSSTDSTTSYTDREDAQLLSNGDFEFFDYPDDAVYLIKTPDSWASGGDSSSVMSGVISTTETNWAKQIDSELAATLDYNNELDEDDDDYEDEYVDYNGMTSKDILYKDSYAANLDSDDLESAYIAKNDMTYEEYFGITYNENNGTYWIGETQVYLDDTTNDYFFDEDLTEAVRAELIENPETHYNTYERNGNTYFDDEDGVTHQLFLDEDANDYYYIADDAEADEDGNYSEDDRRYISNVLMIHNADTSKNNGIAQYYSSSSITIEANTAAEISVWVKTSDLKFDKGYDQNSDQDRGAYIEVIQTVNGTSIDSFRITAINTEKLIANDSSLDTNNGWIKYTIYVNGCNFGDSTIQVRCGLGNPDDNSEKVSGYAFFDDVSVTQYSTLDSIESYSDYLDANGSTGAKTADDKINNTTTCAITGEGDEKIFYADKEVKTSNSDRNSKDFHYLIDLSLAYDDDGNVINYSALKLTSDNVTAGLTYEEYDIYDNTTKYYAASTSNSANYANLTKSSKSDFTLPSGLNGAEITTTSDLVGIFSTSETYSSYSNNYAATLKKNLTDNGITGLPCYSADDSNILLLFSAYGAAYTATVSDETFTLEKDGYMIVSFWVKTFDMNGNTAATVKIYDADDKEGSNTSFTVDSTSYTVDVGDDEDIYNGWTQCFFFVHNDTSETKSFNIDFSFGITDIQSSTATSYKYGWAAMANVQTLSINETIFGLAGSDDHMATFTIEESDDDTSGNVFDDTTAISDIKSEISTPSSYTGVNGASSYVPNDGYNENYDKANTNQLAGLINQEYIENYSESDLTAIFGAFDVDYASFTSAAEAWSAAFGSSYQPLIIVNNLRMYAEVAELDESTYTTGYVLVTDGDTSGEYEYITCNGKTYRKVTDDEKYDEDTTYYSLSNIKSVANYGYIGTSQTISSDSYVTISVKVKVSGNATAYIYLVSSDTKEVLSYTIPTYSFWYDDEGNVLDAEYDSEWSDSTLRNHIIYTLLDNGLYEDKDGNLYGNLLNLVKTYDKYEYEQEKFYDYDGNEVYFDDLVAGETYYTDTNHTNIAPHYLSTATDGTHVFEYLASDNDYGYEEGYYYLYDTTDEEDEEYSIYDIYMIDGSPAKVEAFDTQYAKSVNGDDSSGYEYCIAVGNTGGEWVTVNFFVHTGSEDKTYRLELWSGKRDETGVDDNGEYAEGAVAFDYSSYNVEDSTFDSLLSEYSGEIIEEYNSLLNEYWALDLVESYDESIAYYEDLISNLTTSDTVYAEQIKDAAEAIRNKYTALYYTFSLYDSSDYVPFNADTAEDEETGYDYSASDYSETLAYFVYNTDDTYNTFIDYSAVDQSVSIGTITDEDEDEDEEETDWGQLALYISSIVLVVALLITLVALLLREFVKKMKRRRGVKQQSKNMYRKRERYIRRLHLERNDEIEDEDDEDEVDETADDEETETETSDEAEADGQTEADVETDSEETSQEETSETPKENGDGKENN